MRQVPLNPGGTGGARSFRVSARPLVIDVRRSEADMSSRPCGPTWSLCQLRKPPTTQSAGRKRSTLIIARSPLSDTCYPASCRTTTAAPLVVRGKVFVGISGGEMGRRARVEQSESLSGSANARLCLVGGLSQSFNRAQVIHKTCVTGTLVFLILQAQQRRRVNG